MGFVVSMGQASSRCRFWYSALALTKFEYQAFVSLQMTASIHRSLLGKLRIQLDLSECVLILGNVLLENHEQGLGLLRTEIDALKICNLDFFRRLCPQCAECEKEVPNADAYLDAVRVAFAIIISSSEFYARWLWRHRHESFTVEDESEGLGYAKKSRQLSALSFQLRPVLESMTDVLRKRSSDWDIRAILAYKNSGQPIGRPECSETKSTHLEKRQ